MTESARLCPREKNENNTKKFIDERKSQAMKQAKEREKLKKVTEIIGPDRFRSRQHFFRIDLLSMIKNRFAEQYYKSV
jgi:vacuolar-type H+-ATPase catalytic subunit A/Vma1